MNSKKIGFIGAGSMGQAIIKGFIETKAADREDIIAFARSEMTRELLKKNLAIKTAASNQEVVKEAEVIFLAVKPQVLPQVLNELKGCFSADKLVVSIAAGVTLAKLEGLLGSGIPVIRVMPNTPCLVQAGASAFSLGTWAKEEDGKWLQRMLQALGCAVLVPEKLMDAVTGLSGSGPAYVYLAVEALADGGVREGLSRKDALLLAAQTVMGAAKMVLETGEHPGALKDKVTSPGGTTIEGVRVLEESGFRSALMNAVIAASSKSQELGGN